MPNQLRNRLKAGRYIRTPATLLRTMGSRNEFGEYEETGTETAIKCATAPSAHRTGDPRVRMLTEGGVRLDAIRYFWTTDEVQPVTDNAAGDLIVYNGERFRVREVAPWGAFWEALAVRQEGQ